MRYFPVPEEAVRELASKSEADSASNKVLAEAEEIRAKGNMVRFLLADNGELCVQEGLVIKSTFYCINDYEHGFRCGKQCHLCATKEYNGAKP